MNQPIQPMTDNPQSPPIPFPKIGAPNYVLGVTWMIRAGRTIPNELWERASPHIRWLIRIDEDNQAVWADSREG